VKVHPVIIRLRRRPQPTAGDECVGRILRSPASKDWAKEDFNLLRRIPPKGFRYHGICPWGYIVLIGLLFSGADDSSGARLRYRAVNLEQILENPEQYHQKPVRTVGYVQIDLGRQAIFISEDDFGNAKKGLWLDIPDEIRQNRADFHKHNCIIEGRFNAKNQGRLGRWSGTIEEIKRLELWE